MQQICATALLPQRIGRIGGIDDDRAGFGDEIGNLVGGGGRQIGNKQPRPVIDQALDLPCRSRRIGREGDGIEIKVLAGELSGGVVVGNGKTSTLESFVISRLIEKTLRQNALLRLPKIRNIHIKGSLCKSRSR